MSSMLCICTSLSVVVMTSFSKPLTMISLPSSTNPSSPNHPVSSTNLPNLLPQETYLLPQIRLLPIIHPSSTSHLSSPKQQSSHIQAYLFLSYKRGFDLYSGPSLPSFGFVTSLSASSGFSGAASSCSTRNFSASSAAIHPEPSEKNNVSLCCVLLSLPFREIPCHCQLLRHFWASFVTVRPPSSPSLMTIEIRDKR